MKIRLSSLAALAAILGLVFLVAGCVLTGRAVLLNQLYPLGALLVGVLLYLRHPALYVGFAWWVWFLTPEVRRLVDQQGGWNPESTVMLAPYLVAGLTFFTLIRHSPKLQVSPFLPIGVTLAGIAYGFGMGVLGVGVSAATFDLLAYTVPVLVTFHLMVHWRDYPDYRRVTQHTFAWGLLVMGLYGILQFINPPEWDRVWMLNAPISSIGFPEPYGVRVFSTLNSPASFAVVVMAGMLVLLSGGGLQRWPALAAGLTSFLLSLVRSAWGGLVVGLLFLAAHRGRSRLRLPAALAVIVLIVWPLVSYGPIAEVIEGRLQSFNTLQEDTSFGERLDLYATFAPRALSNVLGEGLGSTGVATKLNTEGGRLGEYGDLDSGLLAIPFVLGWPGTFLYAGGLIWLLSYALRGAKHPDLFAAASRGIAAAVLSQLVFGNSLVGVGGMVFWYFLGLAWAARVYHAQEAKKGPRQSGAGRVLQRSAP